MQEGSHETVKTVNRKASHELHWGPPGITYPGGGRLATQKRKLRGRERKDKGKTGHRGDRVREGKERRGKRKLPRYPGGLTWCCVCKARLRYL